MRKDVQVATNRRGMVDDGVISFCRRPLFTRASRAIAAVISTPTQANAAIENAMLHGSISTQNGIMSVSGRCTYNKGDAQELPVPRS